MEDGSAIEWCKKTEALMNERYGFEKVWMDIVKYVMPMGPRFYEGSYTSSVANLENSLINRPKSSDRSPELYDSTSVWAIDRLSTGIESIITPRTSYWHGLEIDDPLAGEATDEENVWFDLYRKVLFASRYDIRSGFQVSNQKAIQSACALGTGVMMVEEKFGVVKGNDRKVPITYRYIPLSECYISIDYRGIPIGLHRVYTMSARQAFTFFGEKTPPTVKDALNNPTTEHKKFTFVHAVEMAWGNDRYNKMDYVSVHFCYDTKEFIFKSGYHEFPYVVYYWRQDGTGAYGESPVMLAISEIKSLNVLSKHTNRAIQQWTDPPMAGLDDVLVNQPNLNPGKINPGLLDPDTGQVMLKPVITAQNPAFAEQVMQAKREQLKEALYVRMWQILLENREMTATEALIRANEKGELIGPIGDSLQIAHGHMFNREHAIMLRRGAFDPSSALAPPDSLRGKSFGPKFTSQYDRMRRANELLGIDQVINRAMAAANAGDPTVLKRIDWDFVLRITQEIGGAPARVLLPKEQAQPAVDQMQQLMGAQAGAAVAEQGGKAANEVISAVNNAQSLPPGIGDMLSQMGQAQQGG